MHTCRLKACFPTIIELMSSKREGYNKLSVLKIKFDFLQKTFWYIHVDLKQRFTQDL